MSTPSLALALSFLSAFGRTPPSRPLRTLLRATGRRFNPPRREVLSSAAGPAVSAALANGVGSVAALATVHREKHRGRRPTLVLGGFVPDATEQVYLLRGYLSRQGSIYYLDYPRADFSAGLLAAQLDDLVETIVRHEGAPPVVVAVSFGAGAALDWLRRARLAGRPSPALAGLVLVSPVCCADDILPPGERRPTTLLGRALQPMLEAEGAATEAAVAKARQMFVRMFEAGARNRAALATLMTRVEFSELRAAVLGTIAGISSAGALARVRSMREMASPASYLTPELLPLTEVPVLVLYAEKEDTVIAEGSPARAALQQACTRFFPEGVCRVVRSPRGEPVQHASLIFHAEDFLPHFSRFYRDVKNFRPALTT
jgi:hypothetical protein